ncbi:MAG TPA: phosphoribosylamine--glycine ligase, partial [Nitrososphaeraceae archaeon]|nr:phosphoribosylamine--glycine ligase [Nitrososphaeraceae archaeon]
MKEYDSILIIGSGGREHSIGWKLSNDTKKRVYFAPGNGGTEKNIEIDSNDLLNLFEFAKKNNSFTIVGPEMPLSMGIVDLFEESQLSIFGPNRKASRLESSKVFAKLFMRNLGIQTAPFSIFSDAISAIKHVESSSKNLVVKVDGLAAGKGVFVCDNIKAATEAIQKIFDNNEFRNSRNKIVIEERIYGDEASFIALCDGKSIIPLATSQDHKNILDGDKGPNTGGMGSYSPTPLITESLENKIMEKIMQPTIKGLNHLGIKFKGFLYAGLMMERGTNEPYVLEFNVRMGDPECQSILSRMDSNLLQYLEAAVEEKIESMPTIKWKDKHSVCIVMASRGYPGEYRTGKVIHGLNSKFDDDTHVFHSGTKKNSMGEILTNGGRVLSVTSLDDTLEGAKNKCYSVVSQIHWGENEEYYRKDIALKGIK